MKTNHSISVIICLFLSMFLNSCGQEYTIHLDWADGFFSFNDEDEVPEFGNSTSVAIEPEEYLPVDELHPDYYKRGVPYMTAEIEKGFMALWDNHLALSIMIEKLDFPEEAKIFENLIWLLPQTGFFIEKKLLLYKIWNEWNNF